jgi:cell division protein FtsB
MRLLILFAVLSAACLYVAADAIRGTHGLIARQRIEAKMAAMSAELAKVKAERTALERDADLLGPKASSEPSLVDEEARSLLDLAKPTDIVIVNGPMGEK